MYNEDTDLIFPPRAMQSLIELRGQSWKYLVTNVIDASPTDIKRLAFVLLMVKMGGCTSCHSDSYRAIRGCTHCSQQTIRRFRGNDEELIALFNQAVIDVEEYFSSQGEIHL